MTSHVNLQDLRKIAENTNIKSAVCTLSYMDSISKISTPVVHGTICCAWSSAALGTSPVASRSWKKHKQNSISWIDIEHEIEKVQRGPIMRLIHQYLHSLSARTSSSFALDVRFSFGIMMSRVFVFPLE